MKFVSKLAIVSCIAWAISLPGVSAQAGRGPGQMRRHYDPSAETTVGGTVVDVQQYRRGRMAGMHIILKSDSETFDVHLGPSAFIAKEGFAFAKGDAIEVLGAQVKIADQFAIIAREVTKDGKKLTLRDATGRPVWAGPPRRVTG